MKQLIVVLAMALSTAAYADAPKKAPEAKKAPVVKKEKCVPSKEVVCQDSLKGKTRPTPKKKAEDTKATK